MQARTPPAWAPQDPSASVHAAPSVHAATARGRCARPGERPPRPAPAWERGALPGVQKPTPRAAREAACSPGGPGGRLPSVSR